LNPLEVTIDYREAAPIVAESERAKSLYDKKMMNAVIATKMGCSRSRLTKILKYWFESRNLEMPDGRSRRSQLERKHLTPPLYQRIADDVMQLYNGNLPLRQIAQQLGCDINTITTSVRWWHQSHDLAVSDGRTRRKLLSNTAVKNGSPSNMSKESSDTHAVD
jgi:uncharacterized protein YjcR